MPQNFHSIVKTLAKWNMVIYFQNIRNTIITDFNWKLLVLRSKLTFKCLVMYVLKYNTEMYSVVLLLPNQVCRGPSNARITISTSASVTAMPWEVWLHMWLCSCPDGDATLPAAVQWQSSHLSQTLQQYNQFVERHIDTLTAKCTNTQDWPLCLRLQPLSFCNM